MVVVSDEEKRIRAAHNGNALQYFYYTQKGGFTPEEPYKSLYGKGYHDYEAYVRPAEMRLDELRKQLEENKQKYDVIKKELGLFDAEDMERIRQEIETSFLRRKSIDEIKAFLKDTKDINLSWASDHPDTMRTILRKHFPSLGRLKDDHKLFGQFKSCLNSYREKKKDWDRFERYEHLKDEQQRLIRKIGPANLAIKKSIIAVLEIINKLLDERVDEQGKPIEHTVL